MFGVFVFLALCGLVLGEGYWDIQLSPQSIASVPYGSGHISIWQHANHHANTSRERNYATPVVQLLHDTARVRTNILTDVPEMAFDVLLWSEEAREAVYLFLKREFNSSITKSQIEMLPMEKIRITWKDNIRQISERYKLVDNWKSNTHLPPVMTFQFKCETRPSCEDLMNAMKETPGVFDGLEMEYVINGQRSARRSLSVTGKHIMQGRLWTKMTTMTGAGDSRYLNADDLKRLTSESVSTVLGSLVTDSDYVDTGDEVRMNDVLQNVLARQQVSTANFRPHQWTSVFWNPAWARPDKMTRYLNQVLEKDALNSSYFRLNERAASESGGGGGAASFMGFNISARGGTSSNSSARVKNEDVLNILRDRHSNVEWTGEQFRVKPMKLYRLNLSTLNTSNTIATANVQVRRYESVHTIKLRVAADSSPQTPRLTPQLVESRLLQILEQKLEETQHETIAIVIQAHNIHVSKVEEAIMNRTNTHLITFLKKLKAILVPMETKLNSLPQGSYCLLKKGNCPPGFATYTEGMITFPHAGPDGNLRHNFGDSYIKVEGRMKCAASENKKNDIILVQVEFTLCSGCMDVCTD